MFGKVLVLSASVDAGHIRAARAVEKAFLQDGRLVQEIGPCQVQGTWSIARPIPLSPASRMPSCGGGAMWRRDTHG